MKKWIKYAVMLLIVSGYFLVGEIKNVMDYPINYMAISSYVAKGLYEGEATVSTENILVKDYLIEGDNLYIFPLNGEVVLPIGVMVASIEKNKIEVVSSNQRFMISHFDKSNILLFQYVHASTVIASSQDYYVVTGSDIRSIAGRLDIYYAQV